MIKTKPSARKKQIPTMGNRLHAGARSQGSNGMHSSIPHKISREQSLTPLIKGLKTQITRVTDFMDRMPLTREEELLFISQLHALNILRDKFELMKASTSKEELAMISSHLGKKMQSAFSD